VLQKVIYIYITCRDSHFITCFFLRIAIYKEFFIKWAPPGSRILFFYGGSLTQKLEDIISKHLQTSSKMDSIGFLVGGDWNMTGLWLSIYWECHHPNWRKYIFFRGVGLKPPTRVNRIQHHLSIKTIKRYHQRFKR
jgi:hypothetical protein